MKESQEEASGLDLWRWQLTARQQAKAAAVPLIEVDWLLQEVAGLDRLTLRLDFYKEWERISLKRSLPFLTNLWQQRLEARVPIQYLVGAAPWRQFSLAVTPAVLIPRPETECLIDLAVAAVSGNSLRSGHWADLGTGSGAIALGLADVFPQATVHAVDLSAAAVAIAQQNAQQLGFANRIQFYQGSWLQPLEPLRGSLSGIVSNPPYIPTAMLPELQPEVARHEPQLALDGGVDGLDCINHLVTHAPNYLKSGGVWLIEMMAGQADEVVNSLQHQGSYRNIQIHKDLAGIDRFAVAYRY